MAVKVKVGIIGCGDISGAYLSICRNLAALEVVACADIDMAAAKARGAEFQVPAVSVKELLADPSIRIVLNLTPPLAHAEVALAALKAGKNVHNEKPLAHERKLARKVLNLARRRGLLVGCAPDTFMGAGQQTCRKLIDDGAIGTPVAASAFMLSHGTETWHPNPGFFYKKGAGPVFDMGPYYITALVNLLGPVRRVVAMTRISFPERVVTSEPRKGERIHVEVPTHVIGGLEFQSGATANLVMSFDVWAHRLPRIEIYGSKGTLGVPDPNTFGGPVLLRGPDDEEWKEAPLTHGYEKNSRGLGAAEISYALQSGRPHRASGQMAYHVLDVMQSLHEAGRRGRHVRVRSSCGRPAPLPQGLPPGQLDE